MTTALEQTFRESGGRVVSALAAAFRDIDLAEEAFADACSAAAAHWKLNPPADPAAWLFAVGRRRALDRMRRRATAASRIPDGPPPDPTPEDRLMALDDPIPDERLRLIFVCCHPAIALDARAALTLRTVCGLTTAEIARAFLLSEATLAQRLVRAKRKIAEAGIPFEVPDRSGWPERMDAVLSTLEVAYAQAHADAAMAGPHADFAREMLHLTGLLAALVPDDAEAQSLAATLRLAEARRPARLGPDGAMIPLSDHDPREWDADLMHEGEAFLAKAAALGRRRRQPPGPRTLQAAIHGAHATRASGKPTPWPAIVCLYDALLQLRDDLVVRTNRAAAVAETEGAQAALALLDATPAPDWLPWRAARAEMLSRLHKRAAAADEYEAALTLNPSRAEALFLRKRRAASVGA